MAQFEVKVVKVDHIEEHSNADRLTVVSIGGYQCVANKKPDGSWRYKAGDLVVYIPEASIVPEEILRRLNMWSDEKGMGILSGKNGDRVKAIKLRGVVSQGILYPVCCNNQDPTLGLSYIELDDATYYVEYGDDVQHIMGIEKYEPPIPANMAGEVASIYEYAFKYDVENWQKYPEILQDSEEVIFTEKVHGTFMGVGYIPGLSHPEMPHGDIVVFSKGLGGNGLFFKDNENNSFNVYLRMWKTINEDDKLRQDLKTISEANNNQPVYMFGELYGDGVQDLSYGLKSGARHFRGFDIYIGKPGVGYYLNYDEKHAMFTSISVDSVLTLYRGPWSKDKAEECCSGNDAISGSHVREGIVINTVVERRDPKIGRVQLKYINPDYLLRKGNTTEYT